MIHSISISDNSKQTIKSFIFLMVLLPSVNAIAASPGASVNVRSLGSPVQEQATRPQATDSFKAVKRTYIESPNSKPRNTQKSFKDDYERHLVTVTRSKQTKMIWLSQIDPANTPQTKMIWLGEKKRSD